MRIIHTADWHLGQEFHGFSRAAEHDAFLDWLTGALATHAADALVVAGDVFDIVNPPVAAQRRLYTFLRQTLEQLPHLQIVMVGGNHDSAAVIGLPQPLLDGARVHLVGRLERREGRPDWERTIVPLFDRDGRLGAVCAALPYLRPGDLPPGAAGGDSLAALYAEACAAAGHVAAGAPLIATGHLNVQGGRVCELSERRIMVGGAEAVAAETFPDDFCYVALGHLHRPQTIAGRLRFAGAPLPMSMGERGYRHGVTLAEIGPAGLEALHHIETPRPVDFLRVPEKGALPPDEAAAALKTLDAGPDPARALPPYLEVAVTLDGPCPDLRQRMEAALEGMAVRLTRVVRETEAGEYTPSGSAAPLLDQLAPGEVFTRLHEDRFGTPPEADLMGAFDAVLDEALNPQGTQEDDAA